MPPQEAGTQALRISRLFTTTYGWPQDVINRELIATVERHFEVPGQSIVSERGNFLPPRRRK
jgi:hypothetical protein